MVEEKEDHEDEPEQLQDKPKDQGEKLDEVNVAAQGEELRPIFVSANLSKEMRERIFCLLKEFKDVFACTYAQMPGLNPQLVSHKLNIREECKPVKQASRNFRPKLEVQIKEKFRSC